MSHSRTRDNVTPLPRRVRPFWKLSPLQRMAEGLCPHCGHPDSSGQPHLVFGCSNSGRR